MFAFLALITTASAGSILWDGRLNNYTDASFLDSWSWSWSNQAGPYQYYIHGSGERSEYVAMSADYKNPADTGSDQGLQITIDSTSSWNGQTMMRTELIPQTSAAINAGKVFYHFSMQHTTTNPPTETEEHQVCFFESHFTEMKVIDGQLAWYANSQSQWNTTFEAGVWHNIAYEIDFDAQTVSFYHSTEAGDLALIAGPVSASTSSNGADWHLGVLRLPGSTDSGATENWHFSGVYIEDGEVTTSVSGPGGAPAGSSSVTAVAKAASSTIAAPTTLQTSVKPTTSTSLASSPETPTSSSGPSTSSSLPSSSDTTCTSSTTSIPSSSTTAFTSFNVAANPAPTFGGSVVVSEEEQRTSELSRWDAQTTAAAVASSETCEIVYATITVTV